MNVKKVFKIIGIVILSVLIILLIHSVRNFIIIKSLQHNLSNYELSTNYHIKSVANERQDITMQVDFYKKDKKQVTFMERKTNNEIIKVSMYDNGENVNIFTDNGKERTCQINAGNSMLRMELVNYFHTDNDWQTFFLGALARIEKTTYNGKEGYIIHNFLSPDLLYDNENSKNEIYIEKDTGLCVKNIMGDSVTEREYEFDKVEDSIFVEPDTSQYKLINN